jgi:DNA-binding CsgD family transcriptional regulator
VNPLMKGLIFSIFALCFILPACTDNKTNKGNVKAFVPAFTSDTVIINKILRELKDDNTVTADSLLKSLKVAGELSKRSGYKQGLANVLFQMGNISYWRNSYVEALKQYAEAAKIADSIGDNKLKAACIERMGSVHLTTDDPYLALELYYESLFLSEKIGDSGGIAKVYNVLGFFKGQSGQYDSGVMYLNKAIVLNEKLNNRHNRAENLGNLAYLYQINHKTAAAAKIYYVLKSELESSRDKVNQPVIYYNLASMHQGLGHIDSAFYYLRKAMGVAKETADTALLSTIYGNTGEIMLNEGRIDSARIYLDKSLRYSLKTGDVETQLQALSFLIKVDTLTGHNKDAIRHYNLSLVLQDSVNQRKMRNNRESSELQYDIEKKKILINSQQADIKTSKRLRSLYLFLLISALLVGLLLTWVLFLQRRNYSKRRQLLESQSLVNELQLERLKQDEDLNRLKLEKAEEELNVRQNELLSIAMGIEQKNELLLVINKKIREGLEKGLEIEVLNQIKSSIKMLLNDSEESDLFNQRFSNLHKEFYSNLQATHPELSKNELKFCAYLRIQLSSSQIANIMNVTSEAVRKTRYRVRKKMNLAVDVSLEGYIMKF